MKPLYRICLTLLLLAAGCEKEKTGNDAPAVFSDKAFAYYCLHNLSINPNHHEYLTVGDVKAVKRLILSFGPTSELAHVQTLNDLRLFENVEKIELSYHLRHVSEMDLTTLSKLRQLGLTTAGSVTSLDLSGNPSLDSLDCSFNPIRELNLNRNPNLRILSVSGTEIASLDLTPLPGLEKLSCSYTPLTDLDLHANTRLEALTIDRCKIRKIDLSSNPALSFVSANNSWIEQLDLSKSRRLDYLEAKSCNFLTMVYANELSRKRARIFLDDHTSIAWVKDPGASVDADGNIVFPDRYFERFLLERFDSDSNGRLSLTEAGQITLIETKERQFVSLDGIQYMPDLRTLICTDNYIDEVDLSRNEMLETVVLSHNNTSSLRISGCSRLKTLLCSNNDLSEIRLNGSPLLESLEISNNQLLELDTRNNPRLRSLSCNDNQIGDLTVTNTQLEHLACRNNGLFTLDVSAAAALISLDCSRNFYLAELDLRRNTRLQTLDCRGCYLLDLIRLAPGHRLLSLEKEDFTRVVYE